MAAGVKVPVIWMAGDKPPRYITHPHAPQFGLCVGWPQHIDDEFGMRYGGNRPFRTNRPSRQAPAHQGTKNGVPHLPSWIPAFAGMTIAAIVGFQRHSRSHVTSFSYQCHASNRGLDGAFVSQPPFVVEPGFELQIDFVGKNAGQLETYGLLAVPGVDRQSE